MALRTDRILVVDLELTCWEGPPPPGERREILQVGVADVDVRGTLVRSAAWVVRPARSTVSPFCEALTGISAARARSEGRPLPEVLNRLRKEWGTAGKPWAAWGRDDVAIAEACAERGVPSPFSDEFINLARVYTVLRGAHANVALEVAMAECGVEFEGRAHDAGADAVAAARVWLAMARRFRG